MSITRDRELADLLYNSMTHLVNLQTDLNSLNSQLESQSTAVAVVENKPASVDVHHDHAHKDDSPEIKVLADALKKVNTLHHQQEQLIKLLIQNHTDASSILNEFEKIRTAKLLSSEIFTLGHLIPNVQK